MTRGRRAALVWGGRAVLFLGLLLAWEGWAGDYYGIPVASTLDAIRLTGRLEGMIIDPVYEGKSMAALIDLVRTGEIAADSNVLYAHLGGQPALNAYSALFRS